RAWRRRLRAFSERQHGARVLYRLRRELVQQFAVLDAESARAAEERARHSQRRARNRRRELRAAAPGAAREHLADVEVELLRGRERLRLRLRAGLLVLDQQLDHATEGRERHLRAARHPAQQGVLGYVKLIGQRLAASLRCGGLRERPRE